MDCDAIRGRLDVLVGPHTWCGESSHAAIYQDSGMVATAVSSEDPSSETWMSSSAPTHGVGKAHHVIAGSPIDMARYRDFIRGSLLKR